MLCDDHGRIGYLRMAAARWAVALDSLEVFAAQRADVNATLLQPMDMANYPERPRENRDRRDNQNGPYDFLIESDHQCQRNRGQERTNHKTDQQFDSPAPRLRQAKSIRQTAMIVYRISDGKRLRTPIRYGAGVMRFAKR